jgi:UDP-glucose 4-epimerase
VTNRPIESRFEPPREGDPARLVADAGKAFSLLGWRPAHSDLHKIIESAWQWHLAHPEGYGKSSAGSVGE